MHPSEVAVRNMFDAWTKLDTDMIMSHFPDDAIWHNMMTGPIQGHDALRPAVESAVSVWTQLQVEVKSMVVDGNFVSSERVDRIDISKESVTAPVAGFFVIENEKVKIWRDYFDLRSVEQGLNQKLW